MACRFSTAFLGDQWILFSVSRSIFFPSGGKKKVKQIRKKKKKRERDEQEEEKKNKGPQNDGLIPQLIS